MSVDNKVPEVRFKGFSEAWEEKRLGTDVAEIIGGGTPSTSISEFWDGDIDWYSPTEIGSNVYAEGSQKKITDLGLKSSSAKILPAGNTVLFTSRAGIGDMAILAKLGATNQGFQSFVVKEGFYPYFLYSAGKQIKEFALKHASGSTFLEISGKQLGRMKILMPCSEEQATIGNYFQKLDVLINQHQQKHDKLSNLKKSMLEKMFPKPGETIPEIRFKGFSGEWVKNNLGELIDIRSAARVHKEQWTEAGVPFFRTSDVVSIYKGQENTKAYISHDVYHGLSEKIGKVTKNDLLITGGGSIGIPYLVPNDNPIYFKDADLLWLKNNKKFNGHFLYTFFFSTFFKQHIKSISHTGTIAHFTIEQAKVTPINTCSHEEQTAIGNYFKKLDTLINQHQQQITKLNNIKQACLSKMFV